MAELLLIRHAQASFGAADYDRLSPVGEIQAQRLGEWLARCGRRPVLIATGTLRRHRQTAELCAAAAGIEAPGLELPGLDEIDHKEILRRHRPDLVGHEALARELAAAADPHRAFQKLFAAAVERWTGGAHAHEYRLSWPAFRERTLAALAALSAQPQGEIWAFTSGGPIGVIVSALMNMPAARSFELCWPLANTSISMLHRGRRGPGLLSYNAWPHLESLRDPGLVTRR